MMFKYQRQSQIKFLWTGLFFQGVLLVFALIFLRYSSSSENKGLETLPMIMDVHMMLFGGFGFLMTFLKSYSFSAIGLNMFLICIVTEWSIFLSGFLHMEADYSIQITVTSLLEGGLAAGAVLISFGAVLGKLNPFQLLMMGILESTVFVVNSYIGYTLLGAIDIGGSIFIHAFGAYFGLAVSRATRKRQLQKSSHNLDSQYTSDIFAMIGTLILWVYWPSFNAVLAHEGHPRTRAVLNTYLSLLGSTVGTFIISGFLGDMTFDMTDIQNATLAGGVAVGAIADLRIQPYGACIIGTVTGAISTIGYRILQDKFNSKLGFHDTCGVNNLHGIPGVLSGVLSGIFSGIANELTYGKEEYYTIFPSSAPSDELLLNMLRENIPGVQPGSGRQPSTQALIQLLALAITLFVAIIMGYITGLILNIKSLFNPLEDDQLFDDFYFWRLPNTLHGPIPKPSVINTPVPHLSEWFPVNDDGRERIHISNVVAPFKT
ncbi:ammonium transporter Rh type B [Lepeophtheirus salmonis]|uniref:ammonium transporter Rh type B n=1 Tax=Lepeophtheirus salmonis TaxID=72036 RepID=UPI001AE89FD0|nr:ammonium transporter Rh type A-like [Lepeophtheirus salmonis]